MKTTKFDPVTLIVNNVITNEYTYVIRYVVNIQLSYITSIVLFDNGI